MAFTAWERFTTVTESTTDAAVGWNDEANLNLAFGPGGIATHNALAAVGVNTNRLTFRGWPTMWGGEGLTPTHRLRQLQFRHTAQQGSASGTDNVLEVLVWGRSVGDLYTPNSYPTAGVSHEVSLNTLAEWGLKIHDDGAAAMANLMANNFWVNLQVKKTSWGVNVEGSLSACECRLEYDPPEAENRGILAGVL
jgi:hypothetical protein